MRQKKTRVMLALLLSFCMLLTIPDTGMDARAAAAKTKKISGITYKVSSSKKKTATVSKSSKSIKIAKIADKVKIKGKTYKVTSISKNAFKNRKKLSKVTIGKNVKTISSGAFYGDKKLVSIKIAGKSLTKIGNNAFKGIKKSAKFYVPKSKYSKYKKLIKKKKIGWKSTMKVVSVGEDKSKDKSKDKTSKPSDEEKNIEQYTYSVTPLTDDICHYFYVKTDNPDPYSFDFVDENTVMTDSKQCRISLCTTEFADVQYTDAKMKRIKDGYIFYSAYTDGGRLVLEEIIDGEEKLTNQSVTIPVLKSDEQYLIDKYTTDSMSFFEKMDAVQSGLNSICLYSGCSVLGTLMKSTTSPYYGLSTSPHVDQTFYIQDPYYRMDGKSMLVSALYPFRLDSIGFPSQMGAVARTLDDSVTYKRNSSAHWLIDVTYNGETKSYGGQGNGGGQGITENMVKYKYLFDGSANDTFSKRSWTAIRSMIEEYGDMTVVEEEKDLPELTWKDVCNTVGTEGSYVKLVLINSIFGGGGTGYTFLYSGSSGTYPGYFSNAWYDGRYFNSHEFFEKGTKLDTEYAATASIILKDVEITFPTAPEGKKYLYNYRDIEQYAGYDAETGVWSGFTRFNYDKDTGTWICSIYSNSNYYDSETRQYMPIEDEDFKKACTLTLDEVKDMGIDRNADVDPVSYYNYDMTVEPGTKVN